MMRIQNVWDLRMMKVKMQTLRRLRATPIIKAVLEKGLVVDIDMNHKNYGFPTVVFAAPVMVNGSKALMGVSVRQLPGVDTRYYIHDVDFYDENVAAIYIQKRSDQRYDPEAVTGDNHTIYNVLHSIIEGNGASGKTQNSNRDYVYYDSTALLKEETVDAADIEREFRIIRIPDANPPRSRNGDFIVATDNKLAYTNGDLENPKISRVIEINSDDGTFIADVTNIIVKEEEGILVLRDAAQICRSLYG